MIGACSKVSVTVGKDARSDPEFLLEKLGGFDFASTAEDGAAGGKGLEALSLLKNSLAKVHISDHVVAAGGVGVDVVVLVLTLLC